MSILTAMGELGKRTQVPVSLLIEQLKHGNPRIRLLAVESLGKIRYEKAVPALIQLLASEDMYARYHANKALKKIR